MKLPNGEITRKNFVNLESMQLSQVPKGIILDSSTSQGTMQLNVREGLSLPILNTKQLEEVTVGLSDGPSSDGPSLITCGPNILFEKPAEDEL